MQYEQSGSHRTQNAPLGKQLPWLKLRGQPLDRPSPPPCHKPHWTSTNFFDFFGCQIEHPGRSVSWCTNVGTTVAIRYVLPNIPLHVMSAKSIGFKLTRRSIEVERKARQPGRCKHPAHRLSLMHETASALNFIEYGAISCNSFVGGTGHAKLKSRICLKPDLAATTIAR